VMMDGKTLIRDALKSVFRLGVDTSPFICFVEKNPVYYPVCEAVFHSVQEGTLTAWTSVLTLTEVLPTPIQRNDLVLESAYRNLLLATRGVKMWPVESDIALRAAELRASYSLRTPDALQIATAMYAGCDAFFTRDKGFRRVTEMKIILDDLKV
jgi:predicted nucleic acid-binding protein